MYVKHSKHKIKTFSRLLVASISLEFSGTSSLLLLFLCCLFYLVDSETVCCSDSNYIGVFQLGHRQWLERACLSARGKCTMVSEQVSIE